MQVDATDSFLDEALEESVCHHGKKTTFKLNEAAMCLLPRARGRNML